MTANAEKIALFKAKLRSDDAWAARATIVIFQYQTAEEQSDKQTEVRNGVGFNGVDAPIMSIFATQLMRGKPLSENQMRVAHKILPKYAGQLVKLSVK